MSKKKEDNSLTEAIKNGEIKIEDCNVNELQTLDFDQFSDRFCSKLSQEVRDSVNEEQLNVINRKVVAYVTRPKDIDDICEAELRIAQQKQAAVEATNRVQHAIFNGLKPILQKHSENGDFEQIWKVRRRKELDENGNMSFNRTCSYSLEVGRDSEGKRVSGYVHGGYKTEIHIKTTKL